VAFGALYHYAAIILTPLETEISKPEAAKVTIFNANMNNVNETIFRILLSVR
jgi:hypothetical protein